MSTQYIPSIGMFCKNWGGCGWSSDCEELVGATHRRWCGWICEDYWCV